jgi:GrpB-like predicted nucleotidyltransferase (UPF0157 family)
MTEKPTLKALEKVFDDKDLLLFFIAWLKNGQNATKAYLELNPNVDEHSARTLGSRRLAKVDISAILSVYGLDADAYFKQLKEGLEANRTISTIGGKEANNPHHIIGRKNYTLRWDRRNGALLCSSHHVFARESTHQDPEWFHDWLEKHRKEDLDYLRERRNLVLKQTFEEVTKQLLTIIQAVDIL